MIWGGAGLQSSSDLGDLGKQTLSHLSTLVGYSWLFRSDLEGFWLLPAYRAINDVVSSGTTLKAGKIFICVIFPPITFYFLDILEWKEDYTLWTEVKLLFFFSVYGLRNLS